MVIPHLTIGQVSCLLLAFLLHRVHVILAIFLLFIEMLELPNSLSLFFGESWVAFLYDNDVWQLMTVPLRIILIIVQLLHIQLGEIVT